MALPNGQRLMWNVSHFYVHSFQKMWNGDNGSLVGRSWTKCNLDQGEWECLERHRKHSNSFIRRNSTLRGRESRQVRISEILMGRQRPYCGKFVHQLSFQILIFNTCLSFFFIKKQRWNVCQSTHPNEAKSWRNSGKKWSKNIQGEVFFSADYWFWIKLKGKGESFISTVYLLL